MREEPFGPLGRTVPVIGQGTWNLERGDREPAVRAVRLGLDLGLRHVDTAQMYGDGVVESLLGEALEGRRDEVMLVSKIDPARGTRDGVVRACEESLRRLRTDRLDVLLLHWLGPHPFEESIAGFERLVEAGKIGAWGVSNFDETHLEELVRTAGEGRVACNQVLYHLKERAIEHAVLPFCDAHGIACVGYSPFGSGGFPDPDSRGGRVLAEVARACDATPRQVALAFLTRRPSLFAIPKASATAHVRENAAAAEVLLDAAQQQELERAFPLGPHRGGVPML